MFSSRHPSPPPFSVMDEDQDSLSYFPKQSPTKQKPQQQKQQQQQQQQQQSPTGPTGISPTQKLRKSCDACAAAKVKCSKETSPCERCANNGITCIYGPSMRHGKSSMKRRNMTNDSKGTTKHIRASSSDATTEPRLYYHQQQQQQQDVLSQFPEHLQAFEIPTEPSTMWSWPCDRDVSMTDRSLSHSAPVATMTATLDDHTSHMGNMAAAASYVDSAANEPLNLIGYDNINTPVLDDGSSSFLTNSDYSQLFDFESSQFATHSDYTSPSPPNSTNTPNTPYAARPGTASREYSTESHDCYRITNATLALLHFPKEALPKYNSTSSLSSMASDAGPPSPTGSIEQLDHVLNCSRIAVNNLSHLLKCPCSSAPHMAMLYSSIIMKIITWQQLAVGLKPSRGNPSFIAHDGAQLPPTFMPAGTTLSESPIRHNSAPSSLSKLPGPFKIGNHVPDEDDQQLMQRFMIRHNLRKLKGLIDLFVLAGGRGDVGPRPFHHTLAMWLKTELGKAFVELDKGRKLGPTNYFDMEMTV